ncbi:MAG: undecaprenyl-diphosphatase UppP [Syntrophobacteraceae bacterium]|jgi:undecaprenyl-diphosphatase
MSFIEAIILGIIQGITEFLPISSTAHLTIAGKLLGLIDNAHPERWTAFIAVIQLGTLLAVFVYFFRDVFEICVSFTQENLISRKRYRQQSLQSRIGWFVIAGSVPVGVIGLAFRHVIEGHLTKSMAVISAMMLAMALFLGLAEITGRFTKDLRRISIVDSILIGCAQALAVIPGASRSGSTIAGGIFLGMTRESAARFSFLLSMPAVFASGLLEFKESMKYLDSHNLVILIVATAAAAISGYAAIAFLLRYLRTHTTYIFVFYRIVLGLAMIIGIKYLDLF